MHLAQVNVSRLLAPLPSPGSAGFVTASGPVEAEGAAAPGFVWRTHVTVPAGRRTHPFSWDLGDSAGLVVNLSVWESLEALDRFVHDGLHREALRRRREWFARHPEPTSALWWVPVGRRPRMPDAAERLRHLREHGPTAYAFTARHPWPAPGDGEGPAGAAAPAARGAV
ncbi:DUF3291 domain-containing protein [Vallicoccus soli]|uniref:DUF3291 domain-containing protein n=1 Tax=Vallicoccus soli TaxID=2339232 RepID=A0A3A3YZU0_9ACTN|nr:DUF3291 domain-containing protein [Vallicoccus soli]RJK97489.1 DUF3291 domain-containing protein [Vallicoccus soli]